MTTETADLQRKRLPSGDYICTACKHQDHVGKCKGLREWPCPCDKESE